MAHYVCKACKNTSDMAGNCSTEGCSMNGQPMMECNCTDNMHNMGGGMEEKSGTEGGAPMGQGGMGGGQGGM